MKKVITLFVLAFLFVNLAIGDITLNVGDTYVVLLKQKSYTVDRIIKNGFYFCKSYVGTGNGTVLTIDSNWTGSVHGNETVFDTSILVDKTSQVTVDGNSYSGNKIVFHKRSSLSDAYILNSTITISQGKIDEEVSLQGINKLRSCGTAYGFLYSYVNSLSEYLGLDIDGSIIYYGSTDSNDGSNIYLTNSSAVVQYDPLSGNGMITICTKGHELELNYFIWDRPEDNKLYSRFIKIAGTCSNDKYFTFSQSTLFFNSTSDWQNEAIKLFNSTQCPQVIEADINNDCKVDYQDFALLANQWLINIK
jgi:hypothetical protein